MESYVWGGGYRLAAYLISQITRLSTRDIHAKWIGDIVPFF